MGPRPVGGLALLLLLALPLLLHAPAAHGAASKAHKPTSSFSKWRRPPAPAAAPGQHMFMKGEDALEWDSLELSRIRELYTVELGDKEAFMTAPNIAHFLGLSAVDSLHMPVPLNVLFLGFQGDGNLQLNIPESDLVEWFQHLDHDLVHTRVALSELSCSEDGHCAGQMEMGMAPSPLPSHVHLNFSVNVVAVKPGTVLNVFERALAAFSRPTDPEMETGDQQVDAMKMEAFVEGFLSSIGLTAGYTLVVANPRWSAMMPAYGYRMGFSEAEIRLLGQQLPDMQRLAAQTLPPEPVPPGYDPRAQLQPSYNPRVSVRKFKITDVQAESEAWASQARLYLDKEEDSRRALLKALGPRTKGALAVARAVSLLRKKARSELGNLLLATVTLAPEHIHSARFRATHPLQDCITPNWVGHGRWMLFDLTARRVDWGPALGGDGVVTHQSLPDVHHAFADVEDIKRERRIEATTSASDQQMRDELHGMKTQRLAQLTHAQMHAKNLASRVHGVNPGQEAPPATDPDGKPIGTPTKSEEQHEHELLNAELSIYEEFAERRCKGRVNPPVVCSELREQVQELKHELQGLTAGADYKLPIHRDHSWDLFGLLRADPSDTKLIDATARATDRFLAELSAVISRALRHVVAPPSATWHHRGYLHDTASPYAHNVHFQVYKIADTSRKLGPWRAHGVEFDTEKFKQQTQRLALPNQKFTYTVTELNMMDDEMLAVAFATSLKTTFLEVPHAVADPINHEVVYLDSRELALRLRQRFEPAPRHAAAADPHAQLEVPVFVFLLDRDVPVLIDEHYNGRALEDMIVVVQNAANQDEHPNGMVCDGFLLPRPLSPMKHALAAVVQHLGGVLPPHLGYAPSRQLVTHDWLWSVGAHPLSWTAGGTSYAQVTIDALHRSYLLDALDASITHLNGAITQLAEEEPTEAHHKALLGAQDRVRQAAQQYSQVVSTWRQVVVHGAELQYGAATDILPILEHLTTSALDTLEKLHESLFPSKCFARHGLLPRPLVLSMAVSVLLAALALLVVVVVPKFKKKAHQS